MELNNNKSKNIYIKSTRYIKDQRIHPPAFKNKDLGENNLTEKSDISLKKGNNSKNEKTIKEETKDGSQKKNDEFYNENKKNKMVNENVKLFIDNITNNEANSVNIHNINLINSMNNITFFDSYHENKISNQKNNLIKKPINKYNSHQFYKNDNSKNSSSIDFNNNQKNNIIVNKKRIYLNNRKSKNASKSITIVHNILDMKKNKNGTYKQKKNKYFNNIYHKNMNSAINKLKSVSKYDKGNHSLNSSKKEYKIQKLRLGNLITGEQNNPTKRKRSVNSINNNNSLNKTNNKENLNSKSEYFIFNTCSNYSNSVIDEESNRFNKKMILDRMNSKKNVINVNKLEIFKKNKNNIKNSNDSSIDNTLYLSNFKNKNNSNIKISPNFTTNILSLISSNKNNKSKIDIDNLNKIRKNIIHDKLYRARSKDYFNYSKLIKKQNNKSNKTNKNSKNKNYKNNEKPKSEEKLQKNISKKKLEKKKSNEKMRTYTSFPNGNKNKNFDSENNNNYLNRSEFNNINSNDIFNYRQNTTNSNENNENKPLYCYNSGHNSKRIIYNINTNRLNIANKLSNNNFEKINETKKINEKENIEKIEVNTKKFQNINIVKRRSIPNKCIDTRNDSLSLNLYYKKTNKGSWLNSSEQIESFTKNTEQFNYLNSTNNQDEKEREESKERLLTKEDNLKSLSPKNIDQNIIYNKKQLFCYIRKNRKSQEVKIDLPHNHNKRIYLDDHKPKFTTITEDNSQYIKNSKIEEVIQNKNNIRENIINLEEFSLSYNEKENDNIIKIDDYINKNLTQNSNTYKNLCLKKSPSNAVYKKPDRNLISSSLLANKDSFNNKIILCPNKTKEKEDEKEKEKEKENEIDDPNSKKKIRKRKLNIKLNKLAGNKINVQVNKKNICNNNDNDNDNFNSGDKSDSRKIEFSSSISTYNPIKDYLFNSINKNNDNKNNNFNESESKEFFPKISQIRVDEAKTKIPGKFSLSKKYYSYYISLNRNNNINCFYSKMRLDREELKIKINEIPINKICYYSKVRKIYVKIIPKVEICHFNKVIIKNNKNKNNELSFANKKEMEDNIYRHKNQFSFTSINSAEKNINESGGNNYYEISFGKKIGKSLINLDNANFKNNLNNNFISNKFFSPERNIDEENIINEIEDFETAEFNNILNTKTINSMNNANNMNNDNHLNINENIKDDNKCLSYNVNISPSKQLNSYRLLEKAEKGLKILEKIADKRMTDKTIDEEKEKISLYIYNNLNNINNNNTKDKLTLGTNKLKDLIIKKTDVKSDLKLYNKSSFNNNGIKNDFIEILNIITVNNYDTILNKISNLILNNNIVTINNISELLSNQNIFVDIIINKAIKEKKYIKIYSKLCKDLFICLMTIIDNYNDDMDIFDKITKDKSLKVILKNKIFEKIKNFESFPHSTLFNGGESDDFERNYILTELKSDFIGLNYFIGDLLEAKILSQKSIFGILDLLYKRYISDYNNPNITIYNDLFLEGIEILLRKMKNIVYEKDNPEYIQRYNKYIKNYLNNIFKSRIKKNDLPKYLYYKILNILETQKSEEEIKNYKKVKTFVNNKNKIFNFNRLSINSKSNSSSFTILDNKYNSSYSDNSYIRNVTEKEVSEKFIETIRKDLEQYLTNSQSEKIKNDLLSEFNKRYNDQINNKKSVELWEIFYFYTEVCIDIINSEEKAYIANEYIENIINNFAIDISNEIWELFHNKIILLFLNINEICVDNIYMYQIMGYLLFLLIINKLFFIKDFNKFLNKDNQVIINITKTVKYTIIFSDKDAKKFHNDFKQTKLFIGNEYFNNYVTKPLKEDFNFCLN